MVDYEDNFMRTNNLYQTLQLSSNYIGDEVTVAVRAVSFEADADGNGGYHEKKSAWVAAEPFILKRALPEPKVHLELVSTGNDQYAYKAVLENPDDYTKKENVKITVTVTDTSTKTITFLASDGASATTIAPTASGNKTITYQAEDTTEDYGKSVKRTFQSTIFAVSNLKSNDYAFTDFKGFAGTSLSNLYYALTLQNIGNPETYYYSELLTYDDDLKMQTAVSYNEAHVTQYGGTMTATLDNLPKNLIEKLITDYAAGKNSSITVRTYPWRTQAYMSYFGHTVAESIVADQVKQVTDGEESIFEENGSLKPGYIIQKNSNGTYTVIYSLIDAYSTYFAKQIDSKTYTITQEGDTYYLTSEGEKIPVQSKPEISGTYDYNSDKDEYTFSWNQSSASAVYNVTLIGSSLDGKEVEIGTKQVTGNTATFHDDNWNYPTVRLEVQRLGETDSDGKTTAFASSSTREFNLKTRLDTMTAPTVEFHKNGDGTVEKDRIMYDVSWKGLTDKELDALDHYEITVRYPTQGETAENDETAEVIFELGEADATLKRNGSETTEKAVLSSDGKTSTSAVITLDCLSEYGGQDVDVRVRAIAKSDSTTYQNGADGVPRLITLPSRLAVPDMEKNLKYSADPVQTVGNFENKGVSFTMSQSYQDKGSYQMVIEIVDEDKKKIGSVYVNGAEVTKSNPITMAGNLDGGTYTLKGLSAKYAGKYLKVSMRAVADSNISSVWTDQAGQEDRYFQLPKVQVDTPALSEGKETITYKHGSQSSSDWDNLNQTYLEFDPLDYVNEYQITIVGAGEKAVVSEDENHIRQSVCQLRVVKKEDSYEVYALATDDATYGSDSEPKKVGTLSQNLLQLPITRTTTIAYGNVESNIEVYAFMKVENNKIRLILPDCEENEDRFTQNMTAQAIAEQQKCYVNSDFASWYRTTSNDMPVTRLTTYAEQVEAPNTSVSVSQVLGDAEKFGSIQSTTPYRVLYELSVGTEKIKLYSVPGNSKGTGSSAVYDSVLLLTRAEWGAYANKEISLRMCYITSAQGISKWSKPITVTLPQLSEAAESSNAAVSGAAGGNKTNSSDANASTDAVP